MTEGWTEPGDRLSHYVRRVSQTSLCGRWFVSWVKLTPIEPPRTCKRCKERLERMIKKGWVE